MYNWIDGKKYSDSKYLPAVSFISKNYIPFVGNPFEVNNVRRLPVIKEEDGNVSEDELELSEKVIRNNALKKKFVTQKESYTDLKNEDILKESKHFTKLPPLVNINCLMNTEIKQTQSIWDTKFGKRLINGKNVDEEPKSVRSGTKKFRPNSGKSCRKKFGDCKPPNPVSKGKTIRARNTKSGGGDKGDSIEINSNKKKSKSINKDKQGTKKKPNPEKEAVKKSHSNTRTKSIEHFSEPPRELSETCQTASSSFSKNQRFLTEYVQSILDGRSNEMICEYCNEEFQDVEELCKHKKQHEAEKETCLLCDKLFYNPHEFIQHLLTHEGVDRFSCKKCKKYFPSLRKYRQHCLDYHLMPPDVIDYKTQSSIEYVKKWLPKFECKRCKIEFDSEKKQEAHRRNHVKMDLAGAYLLSPKNVNIR